MIPGSLFLKRNKIFVSNYSTNFSSARSQSEGRIRFNLRTNEASDRARMHPWTDIEDTAMPRPRCVGFKKYNRIFLDVQ